MDRPLITRAVLHWSRRHGGGFKPASNQARKGLISDVSSRLQALAERLACLYLTRPDNRHAKAGNINYELPHVVECVADRPRNDGANIRLSPFM
jgi:hypothetical protein